jgi:diguanylate cyclase (GGDEF)-like protein/putative nucleotidyltransferase with HDIG domain
MINDLESAQDTVRQQNEKLSIMAMKDALTGCFNRRAMFDRMAGIWADAKRHSHAVSIVMVDVDHFKSVNDKHGHAVGDQVLQRVARTLMAAAREVDTVCRYGGEEFCVLLPRADVEQSIIAAERLRSMIADLKIGELSVTSSFGIATTFNGGVASEKLLELADAALYAAKRTGRNRAIHADRMPANVPSSDANATATHLPPPAENAIPFPAVTALMAALEHRDLATAAHSRRVADLCVQIASGMMTTQDVLVLEVAALLHDVGKIGVPDCILLKPGALTPEEFEVMDRHSYIGIEIVQAAFKCDELSQIVRTHHAYYSGTPRQPNLP